MIERIFPLYFSVHFPRLIRHIYVLLVLIVGWLIFWRFDPHTYFKVMMGLGDTAVQAIQLSMYIKVDTLLAIVIGVLASTPLFSFLEDTLITQGFLFKRTKQEWIVRTVSGLGYLALFILSVASLSGHTYRPFLYFNF